MLARREITSEALVAACLERISAREDLIGAWEYLDAESALAEARARDREPRRGVLHGLPIGIKDIIDTADMPTRWGSAIFEDRQPRQDAACIEHLREVGAIILGKTVTTEFAYFTPGKTRNPHAPDRTPGGSSSGSAAAVADFMVPIAMGTQAAGSTIRPASFCGVVGFKPTHGRWDIRGSLTLYPTVDTLSVFTRNVEDAAIIHSVLASVDRLSLECAKAPKIGVYYPPEWDQADAPTVEAIDVARRELVRVGAEVSMIETPAEFADLIGAIYTVLYYEAYRNSETIRREHGEKLSAVFQALLERGAQCPAEEYEKALSLAESSRGRLASLFADHDILITPSAVGEAPQGLEATGDPVFNAVWSLLYVPCINIPLYRGQHGLPVGIQAIGREGDDTRLLAVTNWIMRTLALA
jgi:Asp-tRNA(Asn)/Glu-tRNA(Gln) amidotransferase A subunit family amidase